MVAVTPHDPEFGAKMAQKRRQEGGWKSGPKKLLERHTADARKVEQIFATAMPEQARKYVRELDVKAPETCPDHDLVLQCPDCSYRSERGFYNHKAAQYMFDRIMGKPTSRSEVAITVRLVEQLIVGVVQAFGEVNGIPDPDDRRTAFAQRCAQLGAHFGGESVGTAPLDVEALAS